MPKNNHAAALIRTLRMPFAYAPACSAAAAILSVTNGIFPSLRVMTTTLFVDTALAAVAGNAAMTDVIWPAVGVLAVLMWFEIYNPVWNLIINRFLRQLREKFRPTILARRAMLKYSHIEDPADWDLIRRVSDECEVRLQDGYQAVLGLVGTFLGIASVLGILMAHVWWAGLLMLIMLVPVIIISIRTGRASYDADREVTELRRRYAYLGEVLSDREYTEERTLFDYTRRVLDQWQKAFDRARIRFFHANMKWFIRSKSISLAAGMIGISCLFALLVPTVRGEISIGLYISLVTGLFSIMDGISWQVANLAEQFIKSIEYQKDVAQFEAMSVQPEAIEDSDTSIEFENLVFRNVSFAYPHTDRKILQDLSFVIEKGKHYAFVGSNGAGKTTITKLILGLYDGYEGEILLNGREIRTYSFAQRRALVTAVFQDFARYSVTMGENIALGRKNADIDEIRAAVETAGLRELEEKLESGMDTPLGKIMEGGQDISGGEWQKIAMARSILSPAPIRILDEPTSALDPISESRVYEKYHEISRGSTTILISHRLGSARLADVIYVLDGGKVAEDGSHDTLMKKNGIYAAMFDSQRSWYQ